LKEDVRRAQARARARASISNIRKFKTSECHFWGFSFLEFCETSIEESIEVSANTNTETAFETALKIETKASVKLSPCVNEIKTRSSSNELPSD
jgi:hypothetical protein